MVVIPPPVVSRAGALRLRLETDGELRLGEAERLTGGLADKPVAVTQTAAVCEGSEEESVV